MWTRSRMFFVALVAFWWVRSGALAAQPALWPEDCNNVCSESGSCTDTCYASQVDFDNDNRISCYTFGVYGLPCCGDGECTSGEDASSCFSDCHCGDGLCNAGETTVTCPADCATEPPDCTGDCLGNDESCSDCPQDCSTEVSVCGYCGDGTCQADETGGAGSTHDGQCHPDTDEWCTYCAADCGGCDPDYCLNLGLLCSDENGQCRNCDDDDDCATFANDYCEDNSGTCIPSDSCSGNFDCLVEFGLGWSCNGSNVCRPDV
jgi:hypothetical protein